MDADECCIDSADIASICKSCPGLQWLDISSAVQPGADLSVLLQLPEGCESLSVGGEAFADDAVPVLARLTQLQYLYWNHSPEFMDAGLEQLMPVAEELSRLCVDDCGLSAEVSPAGTLDVTWGRKVNNAYRRNRAACTVQCLFCLVKHSVLSQLLKLGR